MKDWIGLAIAGVTLAAVATILAFQPLSTADQWASVGSFVLAGVSFVLALRRQRATSSTQATGRHRQAPPQADAEDAAERSRPRARIAGTTYVQRGPGARFVSEERVETPRSDVTRGASDAEVVVEDCGVYLEGDNTEIRIGRGDD